MEVVTPPKRMTRARAAAKDAVKTKSTATAATASTIAKATKAAPATTKRTATTSRPAKRKTRSDEDEDEEDNQQTDAEQTSTMNKPAKPRGRPKKVAGSEPEPETEAPDDNASTATRATRGRKRVTTEATAPKREPAKTTRTTTRTRKTATEDNNAKATTGPAKKTTRTRATASTKAAPGIITTSVSTEPTPGLKSAVSRPASRVTGIVKKTVSFQEPEKENLVPTVATKAKAKTAETATGMRAKPVRKPAATGRTTRATAKSTSSETREKSPLSPKKDAQNLALSRDTDSDDELATLEKTPLKALMKSPVKPPATKKIDIQPQTDNAEETAQEATEPIGSSVFGSPARRPPASPFKDMMKSPPKKVDAVPFVLSSLEEQQQAASSPSKTSILQSPAKRPSVPIKAFQPSQESNGISRSPVKMSLFQSPAKRPASPFKMQVPPMQSLISNSLKLFGPKTSPTEEKPPVEEVQHPEQQEVTETENEPAPSEQTEENQVELESPAQLAFPGRLSAVLPRHADPALRENPLPIKDTDVKQPEPVTAEPVEAQKEPVIEAEAEAGAGESAHDPMDVDELETKEEAAPGPAPTASPPKQADRPEFGLRAKDLKDSDMSDSEDELASSGMTPNKSQDNTIFTFTGVPSTPTPSTTRAPRLPSSAVKAASRAIRSVSKGPRFSFAPLPSQLNERKFASPAKAGSSDVGIFSPEFKEEGFSLLKENDSSPAESTPTRSFFDEEMKIRAEMENQAAIEAALEADIAAQYDEPEFDEIPITDEDIELAAEANEMSLMEGIAEVEEPKENHAHDDSISDASQEYGDENAVPIDPALLSNNAGTRRLEPVTPVRPAAPRSFHTVSKVPLKPADDSTPGIFKKLSASVSKLSANRPSFFRNTTVTSSVPTKDASEMDVDGDDAQELPPVTPSKADIWSSIGTPARTPRRDLNNSLLRGAVVFVDVHTSDGADASTVFVELLTQMGARCVKSWPWNPTNSNEDGSASKIGITHVVYKDGGKRTLEKVRESNGVVQCVGVGWVLDCERENKWLEEGPYYIDTSLVPRGGRNRRKSMEPKALANLNGTLVTPMKNTTGQPRECQTVPNNHVNRRDSTAWMRTPSEQDEDEDADHDWDSELGMLTPVPKTPAPEAVARFAMDISPDTPSTVQDEDEAEREQLLMRTCPPKKSVYTDLGESVVKKEKDQGILMRLMAARRKSLQFAPKIASPLSKAWN
ncbi:uncharacterized protein F4812DRAFT_461834 [Daldinia caldariorum]|uniref:uncharacterized protein n=1 Tax=Daldinia caldariorum TaxID=326644 RepID=UPI002007947A|nr:uncharacterized protein F4812DRAFT_461834 [Daldinia caldariorum]KAI1465520.1 hypothetical protein F4812DRAFT_461834 [Daldinia caldariorum]